MTEKIEHNISVDVLKSCAAFAVVVLHCAAEVMDSSSTTGINWWIANFFNASVRWSVPVFVMISGALLLDSRGNENCIRFFSKRAKRLLVPVLFWTCFYYFFRYSHGGLTVKQAISGVLRGTPFYHLWYLYMIPGLYLFTPALRIYVAHSSSGDRIFLIILIFTVSIFQDIISTFIYSGQPTLFTMFIRYIGYYLCGYQLNKGDFYLVKKMYYGFIILACALLSALGTGVLIHFFSLSPHNGGFYFYSNFNPVIILMSLSIYHFLANIRLTGVDKIQHYAPLTLGIYALHPFILNRLGRWDFFLTHFTGTYFVIPVKAILTFFICGVIIKGLTRIPYVRYTVI